MGRSVTRSGPFRAILTGRWPGDEAPPAGRSEACSKRACGVISNISPSLNKRSVLIVTAREPFRALILKAHLDEAFFVFHSSLEINFENPFRKDALQGKVDKQQQCGNLITFSEGT